MSTALRVTQNPSLQHTTYLSNIHKVQLCVLGLLPDVMPDDTKMTERHAVFQLESVRDAHKSLPSRIAAFTVLHATKSSTVPTIVAHALEDVAVISYDDYLRSGHQVYAELSENLDVAMYVVKANVVE